MVQRQPQRQIVKQTPPPQKQKQKPLERVIIRTEKAQPLRGRPKR